MLPCSSTRILAVLLCLYDALLWHQTLTLGWCRAKAGRKAAPRLSDPQELTSWTVPALKLPAEGELTTDRASSPCVSCCHTCQCCAQSWLQPYS